MPPRVHRAALAAPLVALIAACGPASTSSAPSRALVPTAVPTVAPTVSAEPTLSAQVHAAARPPAARHVSAEPMPDPRLTPGEAFPGVGPSTFCVSGYTARVRNVPMSERLAVFAEYHVPYSQHADYEVDHLIPLELGGDNSIKNLWPEKGSLPNEKDGLENQLHNLVCHGRLAAATAQRAIATNWVAALHRYGSAHYVYERASAPAPAATTANANGATAKCEDGTYSHAVHHQGACSHHAGVAVWYR